MDRGVEDFEAWVHARGGALVRSAYLLTGDAHLAEDLVQDTLARVAQHWRRVSRKVSGDAVLTEFDSRLDAGCAMAASDALAGDRYVALAQRWFGHGWLAYNLRSTVCALGGAVIVVGVAVIVLRFRRRRAHRLG